MKHVHIAHFLSLAALLSAASPLFAAETTDRVIWLLDAEALAGYSDVDGPAAGDFSTSDKWLASGALKLNDRDQLIGLYNGSFRQSHLFLRQDEGTQSSSQLMANNFSLALKKYFGDDFIFKPVFFYDLIFVKDTANESLGNGLYDYDDLGGGFENTHFLCGDEDETRLLVYGFSVFRREYPNYTSLVALAGTPNPPEENEKDFNGYKIDLRYQTPWWFTTTGEMGATVLFKDYLDKLTIDSNGVRESNTRADTYWDGYGKVTKELTDRLSADLTATFKQNISNLDFYDTRGTLGLADDRFFGGYYDYWAYELRPSVSLLGPRFAADAQPSAVRVSYTFEKTLYPGRPAEDITATLLGEDQEDLNHTVDVTLSAPLSKNWTFLVAGTYQTQTSNQKFEQTYRYSYETWSILSGVRFEL